MQLLLIFFLVFSINLESRAQATLKLSEAIMDVSDLWKQDTFSCKGYRWKLAKKLFDAKIDSVTGKQLLKYLGKPNSSGRVYYGIKHKEYFRYVYYVYMDNCPKMMMAGLGIEFYFDEGDDLVVEVSEINYCG